MELKVERNGYGTKLIIELEGQYLVLDEIQTYTKDGDIVETCKKLYNVMREFSIRGTTDDAMKEHICQDLFSISFDDLCELIADAN